MKIKEIDQREKRIQEKTYKDGYMDGFNDGNKFRPQAKKEKGKCLRTLIPGGV